MTTKKTATKKTAKPTAPAAKVPSKLGSTAPSTEAPVKKTAPGGAEPTWGKSTILIKGGGMTPQKATQVHIQMSDGTVASRKAAEALVYWPTVRLRIVFGRSETWFGKSGTEMRDKAIRAAMKLAVIAKTSWINQDIIGRADVPILKPTLFSKAEAQKLIARTLFVEQKDSGTAWVVLRTGGALSVQYDASVVVLQDSVQLHLPPTAENAAFLEKTLDGLVDEVPFAWASVGYGLGGWASVFALLLSTPKVQPIKGLGIKVLEQRAPDAGIDWFVWLGEILRETPAHQRIVEPLGRDASRDVSFRNSLIRISVPRPASSADSKDTKPAKKLGEELREVVKKITALETRASLRRPVPGSRR